MTPDLIEAEKTQASHANIEPPLAPSLHRTGRRFCHAGLARRCGSPESRKGGIQRDLYLVNPKRPVIQGRQCLGSINELPDGMSTAPCSPSPVPPLSTRFSACAKKGFGSAIVFSAGFAEGGEAGRLAQQELANIAREHGMVLEGPNCLGMVNYVDGIPLTFVVTPPQPRTRYPGAAILSQSGALAAVIAVNMRHHAIPLSYSISTGNEAATGVEDFIEHLIGDPKTRVLALIVEQFRQPKRFLELARRARQAGKSSSCCIPAAAAQPASPPPPTPAPSPAITTSCTRS